MDKLEWGVIVNTHGVRGEMKVMPWLDFLGLYKKVKSFDIDGRSYGIISARGHKDMVLLTLEGVDTMDKAIALKGRTLTTPREAVDLGEGHYFYSDLYGFTVFDERTNTNIGVLDRVESYPGGDVYVVRNDNKGEIMIPASPAFERGVELESRLLRVETIEGMLEDED